MKKSAIISVRVDADTKNKLEIESEMKSMTLNTLIGKLLQNTLAGTDLQKISDLYL